MNAFRFALALTAAIAAAATSAQATAPVQFPATSSASVGGVRLTSEADTGSPLTGVQIFVAGGLEQQSASTNGASALAAECILRTPVVSGGDAAARALVDAVEQRGGSITYAIEETTVHYYLESRPSAMPELLSLLGKALGAPDFGPQAVAAARAAVVARAADAEKNPFRVGLEMFKESYLAAGTAFPDFGTAASLAMIGPSALHSFYAATYRRGGVSATAIGTVTPEVSAAVGKLAQSLPEGTVLPVTSTPRPLAENPPRIVTQRDVGRPFVVVGFGAPAPGQNDFGAMLVLENLLSNAFERPGATTQSLGDRPVGAIYLYESAPAYLLVYVNGGTGVDPTVALREVLLVAKSLSEKPLPPDSLKHYKAAAIGELVTNSTSLSDRSYLIGALSATSLGDTSANGALDAIDRTTSGDVQRAAKAYLQRYVVAIVTPRASRSQ